MTAIPDGYLDHITIAWFPVPLYQRGEDGKPVLDPVTRGPKVMGWTDRKCARPIGWLDRDDDGRWWCLA